jgi:hypothetical protein
MFPPMADAESGSGIGPGKSESPKIEDGRAPSATPKVWVEFAFGRRSLDVARPVSACVI